jgi:chromosome segregation ATPase
MQADLESRRKVRKEQMGLQDGEADLESQLNDLTHLIATTNQTLQKKKMVRRQLEDKAKFFQTNKKELVNFQIQKINNTFDDFLLEGNSTGEFELKPEDQTLDIRITAKVGKDLKTTVESSTTHLYQLSGGEKTKSMLAFLLSIIRSVQSPFFIMDEVSAAHSWRTFASGLVAIPCR